MSLLLSLHGAPPIKVECSICGGIKRKMLMIEVVYETLKTEESSRETLGHVFNFH